MIEFFPIITKITILSTKETVTCVAYYLTDAILHQNPTSPHTHIGDKKTTKLLQLADIFNKATPPTG